MVALADNKIWTGPGGEYEQKPLYPGSTLQNEGQERGER